MFTEIVGLGDNVGGDRQLDEQRISIFARIQSPIVAAHHGREISRDITDPRKIGLKGWLAGPRAGSSAENDRVGENVAEFDNARDAIRCAVALQKAVREHNKAVTAKKEFGARVGVHLGEVVSSAEGVLGEGINVASQLSLLAETGGILVSKSVRDLVHDKLDYSLHFIGKRGLKHLEAPLEVYRVVLPWEKTTPMEERLETRRIAVLPFVSISPDPQDDYFADGLTEELIDRLCQIQDLDVIARTSVMVFKGEKKKAAEIGRELRVGSLVEGSVRKADSRIRVTAQLIDANTEGHLWSSSYDKNLEDIFAVQSDISQQVAEALKLRLLPHETKAIEKKPTDNVLAYSLYLKGHYYRNERTENGVKRGIEYLNKAIAEDPSFAEAYSDLADCYTVMADYGMIKPEEAISHISKYVTKALELDPGLSQPHAAIAATHERNFRWAEAEKEFKRALELNPSNTTARHWYALDCFFKGRREDAIREWRRARELDPLSQVILTNLGYALGRSGRTQEALEVLKEALEIDNSFPLARLALATVYAMAGMRDEGAREARKVESQETDPFYKAGAATTLAKTGFKEEATKILNSLVRGSDKRYVDPTAIAEIYAELGDDDRAFQWLESAEENKAAAIISIKDSMAFERLANDPRFQRILRKIGLE